MQDEKRLTPEEAGKAVVPNRTAKTIRRWITEQGLECTKDGPTQRILISKYALKKFCRIHGILIEGEDDV